MANNKFIRHIKIEADAQGNPPETIQLLHVGSWNTPWHGDFETTEGDIHEYVEHYLAGVGLPEDNDGKIQLNYSHKSHEKAAGWMSNLRAEEVDGVLSVVADISYTPAGKQALADEEFRYISPEFNPRALPWEDPEEEWRMVANVITGAALTNIPLFKKLKKVAASERPVSSKKTKEGDTSMSLKLEDVRVLEASALTDEHKAFLETHKADLTTEEREKFGIKADEKAPKTKVEANAETVTISASELAELKASANQGVQAAQKLAQKEASDFADARIAAGQVKSGEKDKLTEILLASEGEARTKLEDFLSGLPVNADINHESGENKSADKSASDELADKAQAIVTASQGKTRYTDAIKEVLASDKELRTRVETERNEQ